MKKFLAMIGTLALCFGVVNAYAVDIRVTPDSDLRAAVKKLQPGDTLILSRGVYKFADITMKKQGDKSATIVIRGEERDSTIITAWESLDGVKWEKVPGQRFVYCCDMPKSVHNVVDLQLEKILLKAPEVADIERYRGTYVYDRVAQKLYLHTFDGKIPRDGLRVGVFSGSFFLMLDCQNIVFQNLTFCGAVHENPKLSMLASAIRARNCENITVEDCSFYYNSGGVNFTPGCKHSICRRCFFKRNESLGYSEAAQLFFGGGSEDNLAEDNLAVDNDVHGVRFYSGAKNNIARRNVIVGTRIGLYYKATAGTRLAERNVVVNSTGIDYSDMSGGRPITDTANTFGPRSYVYDKNPSNLLLKKNSDARFCAPEYYDFRLQKDSPFLGHGAYPDVEPVFYLSNAGNDTADGQSERSAWRTFSHATKVLKPGSTLYIASGKYNSAKVNLKDVVIRGRGEVEFARLDLSAAENVELENLRVGTLVLNNSRQISLKRVVADEVVATTAKNAKFYRCEWSRGNVGESIVVSSKFAGKEVGHNPESPVLAGASGKKSAPMLPTIEDFEVVVRGNTATARWVTPDLSLDIYRVQDGWWSPHPAACYLEYGETKKFGNVAYSLGEIFHHVSLNGLRGGATYYCRVVIPRAPMGRFKNIETWKALEDHGALSNSSTAVYGKTFTFSVKDAGIKKSRAIFVSTRGNDGNIGSEKSPYRTLRKACQVAGVGDTVWVEPGCYCETLEPENSGLKDAPLIFKAKAPGTVVIDGSKHMRPCGIRVAGVKHIKFDGFMLRNFSNKSYSCRAGLDYGSVQIFDSEDITLENCVISGEGIYQMPVVAVGCNGVICRNNVLACGVDGFTAIACDNVLFERNTLYGIFIHNLVIGETSGDAKIVIRNNVIGSICKVKVLTFRESAALPKSKNIYFDHNLWIFSPSDAQHYCGGEGDEKALSGYIGLKRFFAKTGYGEHDEETTNPEFKHNVGKDVFDRDVTDWYHKLLQNEILSVDKFELKDSSKYGVRSVK